MDMLDLAYTTKTRPQMPRYPELPGNLWFGKSREVVHYTRDPYARYRSKMETARLLVGKMFRQLFRDFNGELTEDDLIAWLKELAKEGFLLDRPVLENRILELIDFIRPLMRVVIGVISSMTFDRALTVVRLTHVLRQAARLLYSAVTTEVAFGVFLKNKYSIGNRPLAGLLANVKKLKHRTEFYSTVREYHDALWSAKLIHELDFRGNAPFDPTLGG